MQLLGMLLTPDEAEAAADDDGLDDALDDALGEDDDTDDDAGETGRGDACARRRPRRGRRQLPEALPPVEIEVLPPEVIEEGLSNFRRIGEVVERRPASLVVARIVRPKFARKDDAAGTVEKQLAEETPEVPAPRRACSRARRH